ncbi:MAG: beta-propeller domain-containing protein, partial [Candidatus Thermoplasmatota archaeon]|nr:beta-propeller domain-containing protein [Candidatus Thermoplasmatota archaeon]
MNNRIVTSLGLVLLMLTAGCIGNVRDEIVTELPDDWKTKTTRTISQPHLVQFDSCLDMEYDLKASIAEEYRTQLLQAVEEQYYYGWGMFDDGMVAESAMDGDVAASGSTQPQKRTQGEDFSGTNNQEQGVDEADFIKTDGYFIYALQGSTLSIMSVPEYGEIEFASNTSIEGSPISMMLRGDRLIVLSSYNPWSIDSEDALYEYLRWGGDYSEWRVSSMTKYTTYNISDRTAPEVVQELYLEGYNVDAREINGSIRAITHSWLNIPGLANWLNMPSAYYDLEWDDPQRQVYREMIAYETIQANNEVLATMSLENLVPKIYQRIDGQIIEHDMRSEGCQNFAKPMDGFSRGFTNILSLDLFSPTFDYESDHLLSNHPMVYASQDALVLTENAWDWWWFWGQDDVDDMTNIHTFDISIPGVTTYTGSGRIDGQILNQFSISEHEGVLRVATTVGQWNRWWIEDPEPMSSSVITLVRGVNPETDQQILLEYGRLDGIAEGERIWSARFVEDRAYIVTFEQIDPLWTIDLSDPSTPTILGELEVPGVSTYIHPLHDDMLLTIGMGPAGEDGLGLDWSSTRLSTFNISDLTKPAVADTLMLSPVDDPENNRWAWSYSEAKYEHKAFQYWGPKEMLAVPLSTYRYVGSTTEDGGYQWHYEYVSKAIIVNVDEATGNMSIHGEVNHSSLLNHEDVNHYWG